MKKAALILGLVLIVGAWGCSSSNSGSSSSGGAVVLTESGQHVSGWLKRNSGQFHADAFLANPQQCTECHGATLLGGIARVSCNSVSYDGRSCHPGNDAPHLSPLRNLDGTIRSDNIQLLCGKCHDWNNFQSNLKFQCQRCHASSSDTSDPLNGTLKDQYPLPFPYGFGSAPNVKVHDSTVVGTKYGNWVSSCVTCHNPHAQEQNNAFGTSYGKYIKRFLTYFNNVTGQTLESFIQFIAPTGTGSFADGPPHDENICEMCHTRTNHHWRSGMAPADLDPQGNYVGHFDRQNCTQCHRHGNGFAFSFGAEGLAIPPPHNTDFFIANCEFCHLTDPEGNTQFSAYIPSEECTKCHGTRRSHSSTVSGTGKYDYSTECVDCHDPMFPEGENIDAIRRYMNQSIDPDSVILYTSREGEGSFADGAPFNENVCEACHSETNHHRYDGRAPGDLDASGNYVGHFDGEDCRDCHNHNNSFLPE